LDWLRQFEKLQNCNIYSMEKIEWWLLKYSIIQRETHDSIYSQHKFELEDGSFIRLPPFGKISEQEVFLDLYEALDVVSKFHRYEEYFEQQMVLYSEIRNSPSDLKDWIANNEILGANKYSCFLLDYLDYDEDEKVVNLNIYVHSLKIIDIFVARKDFKHTISFLETFNEQFWVKNIISKD